MNSLDGARAYRGHEPLASVRQFLRRLGAANPFISPMKAAISRPEGGHSMARLLDSELFQLLRAELL